MIPVYAFVFVAVSNVLSGRTERFLERTATIHWGLMVCVYCVSYAPALLTLEIQGYEHQGQKLLLFLTLVDQMSDVLQYVFGKLFGKHKIAPSVSPNKTWEGFIGGWVTTSALIWVVGPLLAPMEGLGRACIALSLPLAGFAGDVTLSAVKRDIGVKDTSSLIPGHGGMLDRADSLVFTTPLYFHLLAFFSLQKF